MASQTKDPASFPAEISGWDAQGNFFVRTVNVDWDPLGGRTVSLRCHLPAAPLVFLRLLSPAGRANHCPNAFTVEVIDGPDYAGWYKLRLVQLRPQRGFIELPEGPLEHLTSAFTER